MNQNYVKRVLGNPRTPRENREAVIAHFLDHPEKFTPLAENTDKPRSILDGYPRSTGQQTSVS